MTLSTNLPTDKVTGDPNHVAGHNATNTRVNEVATEVNAHEAATTSVHGITNTAALATSSSVTSAIGTHAAASDPHGDRAYADTGDAALDVRIDAATIDGDTLGVTGSGSLHDELNTALAAVAASGAGEVRLRSRAYDLSGGHVLVPAGVTLRGVEGTVLNGGAYAIINDGEVADLTIGTGWSLYQSFFDQPSGTGAVAIIGGKITRVARQREWTELWATANPHNCLTRTVTRLRTNLALKKTKIVVIGDSLAHPGSGSGVHWQDLLFNNTYAGAEGAAYNMSTIYGDNNTQVLDLAVAGSNAQLHTAHIAAEHTSVSVGDSLDGQAKSSEAQFAPPLLGGYDLAIICTGHNGQTEFTLHLENLVAALRANGTEVILVTQNPTSSLDANYARPLWRYRQIAATYGCAVADTYAAFLREVYSGRSTAAALLAGDGQHGNQTGWNIYAATIRDVLLAQTGTAPAAPQLPARRGSMPNTNDASTQYFGNYYGAQFVASAQSGGVSAVTPSDTTRSPLAGRRASLSNTAYSVPNGDYVEFAVPDGWSLTVIGEGTGSAANGAIKSDAGGTSLGTFSADPESGKLYFAQIDSGTWGAAALVSRPVRVYSTSGTLKIVGVVWAGPGHRYQPKNTDGSYRGVTLTGTWGVQTGPWYGVSNIPYTDTTGSYLEFDIVGDGYAVKVASSPAAGAIVTYVDGQETDVINLQHATTDVIHTVYEQGLTYGRHRIRIKFDFVPGGASAVDSGTRGYRRLAVYEIATLDSRMNATMVDLTRPADVI